MLNTAPRLSERHRCARWRQAGSEELLCFSRMAITIVSPE
jgi:hypothetical protein